MMHLSLRSQIVGAFVLLYGLMFTLLLFGVFSHTRGDYYEAIDQSILQDAAMIEALMLEDHTVARASAKHEEFLMRRLPPMRFICIERADSILYQTPGFPDHVPLRAITDPLAFQTFTADTNSFRIIQKRSHGLLIQIAVPTTVIEHIISEAFLMYLLSVPTIILFSILAGYFLVRKVLRPLDVIMTKAREITSKNLDERIPPCKSHDEIDRLVVTLNEMIDRLEQSFNRMDAFTANVSHELRTPLTILKGELAVALQNVRSLEEYRQVLISNLEEVKRISQTVDNLFMLAKMDNNQITVQFEAVDIPTLIEEVVEETRMLAERQGITLHVERHAPLSAHIDPVLFTQLFLIIIDNAIKYNIPQGWVRISIKNSLSPFSIIVSDSGIGIPAASLPKIFDRFYRVDKNRSLHVGGVGLGLSMAQWIVKTHHGNISVESEPGHGTSLTITLPLVQSMQ